MFGVTSRAHTRRVGGCGGSDLNYALNDWEEHGYTVYGTDIDIDETLRPKYADGCSLLNRPKHLHLFHGPSGILNLPTEYMHFF
ncbi:uncharacterized protein ARMOST_19079 [Armillaria ostoyae]|uniref:Uncharacterized protein n=1 Tax=Armillaria ostoyae TaxID=47428 RepID=A0A284S3J0_ARMOS|nr:uncharacterized protein ARMOST_19079 [Armillaria ostoyae]